MTLSFGLSTTTALSVSVNVFNLFNFQQVTSVADRYTLPVLQTGVGAAPIPNGNPGTDRGKVVDDFNHAPSTRRSSTPISGDRPRTNPSGKYSFQARLVF